MKTKAINSLLLIILILIVISCTDKKDIQIYDISGSWKVISFVDDKTSTEIMKTEDNTWSQYNNGDNTISFTKSNLTNGIVSGKNVTNSFSGEFMTDSIGKISIVNLLWTEISEPDWGKLFHSISFAESYEIKNNVLTIFYNSKMNSIILEKIDNK